MDKDIIIVGGFHEIIELCEIGEFNIVGIIDNNITKSYLGYPILGKDSDAEDLVKSYNIIPLVISPDSPKIRFNLVEYYSNIGFQFQTIISPDARISKSAKIGTGTIIQSGVNISSFAQIGNFVKLNTNCNIMHNSTIGNFTTIAPNAVILGRIDIKEMVYIGANSTILPELTVNRNVIIGAGAVVTKNISENKTVKGIPAR